MWLLVYIAGAAERSCIVSVNGNLCVSTCSFSEVMLNYKQRNSIPAVPVILLSDNPAIVF